MTSTAGESGTAGAWRRRTGVTALRSLIVGTVLAAAGVVAVVVDVTGGGGADGWEGLQMIVGTMFMTVVGFGYAALIYSWVDHLVARRGRIDSASLHALIASCIALCFLVLTGGDDLVRTVLAGVLFVGIVLAATAWAGRVRDSFSPAGAPPE